MFQGGMKYVVFSKRQHRHRHYFGSLVYNVPLQILEIDNGELFESYRNSCLNFEIF